MIDVTLEQLFDLAPRGALPPLCNLIVRLASAPEWINEAGGRWELAIETPGNVQPAWIAVHRNPHQRDYGYPSTSSHLLQTFEQRELQALYRPTELVTVQASPRWSTARSGLYLNVEAILILRPWRTFGRRQVDYAAGCNRKHFLAVAKGVRTHDRRAQPITWQSLAGQVAHDLIEAGAGDLEAAQRREDAFIRRSISAGTLVRLLAMGAIDPSAMVTALTRGIGSLDVLQRSAALSELLRQGGPWRVESDALDRGVTMTPDLIGDRVVIEIKQQSPESAAERLDSNRAQAGSYLAWAMVTYGIDPVVTNWRALLVNVHPRADEQTRISEVRADRAAIGLRVFHRHRLLALLDGDWLPPPREGECTYCEFHRSENGSESLPPACQYYCQAERSWSCEASDGSRECPLYGVCDEHRRYQPYERLDLFNRLRRDLLVEDEEAELVASLVATEAGRTWGPFAVREQSAALLQLQPLESMTNFDAAAPGQVFAVLFNARVCGLARFRRLRRGDWQLIPDGRSARVPEGAQVRLSAQGLAAFPARSQLNYLDRLQRLGEPPGVLRSAGHQRTPVTYISAPTVADIPLSASCVVVDCASAREQSAVLDTLIKQGSALPSLILAGQGCDREGLPAQAVWLDEFAASQAEATMAPSTIEALRTAARQVAEAPILVVPWDLFLEGVFDAFGSALPDARRFADVFVLDAHAFPMLGLQRCFAYSQRRVVLLGSSLEAGPWTDAPSSSTSPLFQNLVRSTIESGGYILPESVTNLAVTRTPINIAAGLEVLPILADRSVHAIPTQIHVVQSDDSPRTRHIELRATVSLADPNKSRLEIELSVLPHRPLALRVARTLLRLIPPSAIEELRSANVTEGTIDQRLLTVPVRVDRISTRLTGDAHRILIKLPEDGAPLVLREGLSNGAEASEVISYAAARPSERFIATSPFAAQCRALSSASVAQALGNIRIVTAERLGQKAFSRDLSLLISLAATTRRHVDGWPFADLGRVLPLFVGQWNSVHLFCSPLMKKHPLIERLCSKDQTRPE